MEFSVLMSVYRNEKPKFLNEALQSIIHQTLVPTEIVIVQDGELTSELYATLDGYQKKYPGMIKFVPLKENVGLGKALELGVTSCKYELIARMDTDDICHPNRFEKQVNFLANNPEVQVVGSWIGEFEDNPNQIKTIRKVPIIYEELVQYAQKRNPLNHMTVMYRKSAVLNAGNYKPFLWNEDYYLWVRMLSNNNIILNMPEILVYARTGKEMLKRRGGFRYLIKDIELQNEFLKLGFINRSLMIKNVFIRGTVRLLPNSIRGIVYKSILRS